MINKREMIELRLEALEALIEYMVVNEIDVIALDKEHLKENLEAYEDDLWPEEHDKN